MSMELPAVARGVRFSARRDGREVGHAYLYFLTNDLHKKPFGFLEDVWVDPAHRECGIGNELLNDVLTVAIREGCYKLIATSRDDGTRPCVHDWYIQLGFKDYGKEFRMNF